MRKDPRSIPFAGLAHVALERSLAKPSTLRGYRRAVALVSPTLGRLRCGEITPSDVRAALAGARDAAGLSPKSLQNVLGVVKLVLGEAGCQATAGAVRVPQGPRKMRALSAEQIQALRDSLQALGGPEARALLALLATGLRLGELLALTGGDFDAEAGRLRVRGQKSHAAARVVDVPSWAGALFQASSGDLIFQSTPFQLRRILGQALTRAGLPRIRLHDLRHSRFTSLLLAGAPVLYVSEQAGHATPAFTLKVYGHVMAATSEDRRRWCNL